MTNPVNSEKKLPSTPQLPPKPQSTVIKRVLENFLSFQKKACLTEGGSKNFRNRTITQLQGEKDQARLISAYMKDSQAFRDYDTWTRYNLRPY